MEKQPKPASLQAAGGGQGRLRFAADGLGGLRGRGRVPPVVMLGVMCIKIGLFTAAAAHLGWLFCGAEQVGDSPWARAVGKDVPHSQRRAGSSRGGRGHISAARFVLGALQPAGSCQPS